MDQFVVATEAPSKCQKTSEWQWFVTHEIPQLFEELSDLVNDALVHLMQAVPSKDSRDGAGSFSRKSPASSSNTLLISAVHSSGPAKGTSFESGFMPALVGLAGASGSMDRLLSGHVTVWGCHVIRLTIRYSPSPRSYQANFTADVFPRGSEEAGGRPRSGTGDRSQPPAPLSVTPSSLPPTGRSSSFSSGGGLSAEMVFASISTERGWPIAELVDARRALIEVRQELDCHLGGGETADAPGDEPTDHIFPAYDRDALQWLLEILGSSLEQARRLLEPSYGSLSLVELIGSQRSPSAWAALPWSPDPPSGVILAAGGVRLAASPMHGAVTFTEPASGSAECACLANLSDMPPAGDASSDDLTSASSSSLSSLNGLGPGRTGQLYCGPNCMYSPHSPPGLGMSPVAGMSNQNDTALLAGQTVLNSDDHPTVISWTSQTPHPGAAVALAAVNAACEKVRRLLSSIEALYPAS
ncbi:hypothetical protein H696_00277 [Fonticula alba]|uniref:Uncharacterized protein n=1 Tax=Fonticula alba TaxID=691883 RepID=A0A058ZFJ4_FONAL|nr:hypothetical protein H696_00277 [Fonticula alba]KCV72698.1 hypothetical protein H696_00277 [Fonticula alba]|eukprot:XP_009492399.1 hypothetical protein H696_00277 [Fonticula alba]